MISSTDKAGTHTITHRLQVTWEILLQQFTAHLHLERTLSPQTVVAYLHDVRKLEKFLQTTLPHIAAPNVSQQHLRQFMAHIHSIGLSAPSQARICSSVKAFYKFLMLTYHITEDPTAFIVSPKTTRKLPQTLAIHEIEALFDAIDETQPTGIRNRAILETLYSAGLRVSELITLRLNHVYAEEGFLRVLGKGDKERLVPVGKTAIRCIQRYLEVSRCHVPHQKEFANHVFLNRRGKQLTRHMIFLIVQALAKKIGLKQPVGPHNPTACFCHTSDRRGCRLACCTRNVGACVYHNYRNLHAPGQKLPQAGNPRFSSEELVNKSSA
jgi:integrase/recombinase XerD